MAYNPAGVDDAIAALTVTGLTIYTQATIPDEINPTRGNPCLYPAPEFITGENWSSESVGSDTPLTMIDYTLNYNLAYTPVGAGRKTKDWLRAVTTLAATLKTAIANHQHSLSATHVLPSAMQSAVVVDPVGNQFLGATIAIAVHEELNL